MQELRDNNPGKYVYTKYVMNWLSPGDPYYTAEGGKRKNFYNVNGVPSMAYNGIGRGSKAVTQEELDEIYNSPAFIDIKGSFNIEGNNINVVADVMSYIDIDNVKVHITVNEKTTTGNFTYDYGLKEFHHVMMKMFPDAEGSSTNFKTGEHQRFEFTHDMNLTFVEEMKDLEIAVWIQDITTREIYNSRYLYEYCEHPYPVQNLQLTNDGNLSINWEAPEKGSPLAYNLYVNNELVLDNTTKLSYVIENPDGFYSVEVVAYVALTGSIDTNHESHSGCGRSCQREVNLVLLEHLAYIVKWNLKILGVVGEGVVLVLVNFFNWKSFGTDAFALFVYRGELVLNPLVLGISEQTSRQVLTGNTLLDYQYRNVRKVDSVADGALEDLPSAIQHRSTGSVGGLVRVIKH